MLSAEEINVLLLSARIALWATLLSLPLAIALAWLLARHHFRGKFLLEAALQLPLVLPPVVVGYVLLVSLGTQGWLGQYLWQWFAIRLAFDWKGAVLAATIMAFPLMVQPIRLAFELMDQRLEQVAATLGARPWQVFLTVSLPASLSGLLMGCVLCFSRSLGEFGATMTFVGNIPDETRTIPLAIYALLQQPDAEASVVRLVLLSVLLSLAALIANFWLTQRQRQAHALPAADSPC